MELYTRIINRYSVTQKLSSSIWEGIILYKHVGEASEEKKRKCRRRRICHFSFGMKNFLFFGCLFSTVVGVGGREHLSLSEGCSEKQIVLH